jgi:hypothetical protein
MNAKHVLSTTFLSFVLNCSLVAQGTLTITFDGPPAQPPGTQYGVADYYEAGIRFTPLIDPYQPGSLLTRNGGGIQGTPENGTAYLQSEPEGVIFRSLDNSLFGLRSLDIAAYSDEVSDILFRINGYRLDDSTITADFVGSGIEWRNIQFGSEWSSGLIRVEIPGATHWSLDNVVLNVPEPTSSTLMLVGVATAILFWRRFSR